MRKTIGFLLILGVSTLGLSGCFFTRVAGPCYGVGCPAFSSSGTQKTAAVPQPAGGNVQAQKSAAAAPTSQTAAESSQAVPAQARAGQFAKPQRLRGRDNRDAQIARARILSPLFRHGYPSCLRVKSCALTKAICEIESHTLNFEFQTRDFKTHNLNLPWALRGGGFFLFAVMRLVRGDHFFCNFGRDEIVV
jgi:hypothetical protein